MSSKKSELPGSWLEAPLGEVVEPTRPRHHPFAYPDLPFIGMEHVEAHTLKLLGSVPASTMKSSAVHFQPGDVLYGRLRPYLNKVYKPSFEGLCSAEFIVFPASEHLDPDYLKYLLSSASFVSFASRLNEGDRPRVDFAQIAKYPFPLAPLPEQRRIVEVIDKQVTRLDSAIVALKRAQASLKSYRASLLRAACEGRLVSTEAELARTEGRPYEPAEALLKRTFGKTAISNRLDIELPALPAGWTWTHVERLAKEKGSSICAGPFGTIFKAHDFRPTGVPIIFLRHVKAGEYSTRKPTFMDRARWEDLFQPYSVYGGELLITKLGEPPGLCAIYPQGRGPAMLTPDVIKMDVDERVALPAYLMYYLNSPTARRFAFGAAFGTTRLRLTLPIFRNLPVPLPPRPEQERIVEEIDRKLSTVDALESCTARNELRSEQLRQAILRSAFTGGLASQDPTDEPASVLLERIRQERAQQSGTRSRRGRPQKAAPDTDQESRPSGATESAMSPGSGAHTPGSSLPPHRGSDSRRDLVEKEVAEEPAFVELPRSEQIDAVWEALLGQGALEKDEAVRVAAEGLRARGMARFQRLRRDGHLYEAIQKTIEVGVREGFFDRPARGQVRAVLRDPRDYTPETWQECLLGVLDHQAMDQNEALRGAAEWARENLGLEFARLREDGIILGGLREALKEAVRAGIVKKTRSGHIQRVGDS